MKKITDKDVERLKAGKKITKGFIHCKDCVNAYKSSKKANADGGG